MSCWLHMQIGYLKRSIQDAGPCLEMTRWRIFLGCTGFIVKYLEAWSLLLMYSSSMLLLKVQPWFNRQKML
ncbi:hypothetical protein ERO13_A01G222900v2 [Gossypium hirsutum]|nr:hypothetical protein ERO13_A01G222900v2 [Gossypium hirsutum]